MLKNQASKHFLCIEMNIKLIFILMIFLFVKIVSYFVFPGHIRFVANTVVYHKRRFDVKLTKYTSAVENDFALN